MQSLTHRLLYMLTGIWRRRYVIVIPILVMPIIGGVIGAISPKKYQAHTSMLIQETAKHNPFLEDFSVSPNLKERMASLQILVHSRYVLTQVAEELGMINEKTEPYAREIITSRLSSKLNVSLTGKDLIKISMTSDNPNGMKETLETVTKYFVEQLLAPERSSIHGSERFLKEQLAIFEHDLNESEKRLALFKDENAKELPSLFSSKVTRLSKLKDELANKEIDLAGTESSQKMLEKRLASSNPVVGKIEEKIVEMKSELAIERARYTDDHSKVKALLRMIERLEKEYQSALNKSNNIDPDRLWDMLASPTRNTSEESDNSQTLLVSQMQRFQEIKQQRDSLVTEVESYKTQIARLELETSRFGEKERLLSELQRDFNVKRKLYEDLLQRYEMARVTRSLGEFETSERIKIIDQPYTPSMPINPSFLLLVIGGFFGGIFIGIGLGTLLEVMDSSIRSRSVLESLTGIPVLTRIPPHQVVLEYR